MVPDENLENEVLSPFSPCRIIKREQLITYDAASAVYMVAPLDYSLKDEGEGLFYGYGFTGREEITSEKGGVVVVSGIAEVHVTREQIYDGFQDDLATEYAGGSDSMYYVIPDKSISNNTDIRVAPTGHFRIIGRVRSKDLSEEMDEETTKTKLIVDMNQCPTTVIIDIEDPIAAATYDEPTKTLEATGGLARVLEFSPYEDEYLERGDKRKFKDESKQQFKINVFNDTKSPISVGRHKAMWSTEYNCFLFVIPTATIFQVTMTENGGTDGTATTPTSWLYDIRMWEGDNSIIKAVMDIVESPNHYRRPNVGRLTKASFGTATYNAEGELVIIDCNETLILTTC
jgi:hypothetical protein